jgi:AcrR family transcriptional regulator
MTKRPTSPVAKKKKKPLVRGEPVVQSVLGITLDELARRGFVAFRVEDVANRAGVNKTTIYRRWPTKAALVRAALLTIAGEEIRVPDTGSLRGDLAQIGHQMIELAASPHWQVVIRMILAEGPDAELRSIAQSLRESYEPLRRELMSAAVLRGDVATIDDGLLILELFDAAMFSRLFVSQVGIDTAFIERVADLLVSRGLATVGPKPKKSARPR